MPPSAPLIGTDTIHPNNEVVNTPQIEYSEAAQMYLNYRRRRMVAARDVRDAPRPEFDDMSFLKWYDLMKKAGDQYVAPRKNKADTAINTGTIRDKDTALVEYANKYDFEPVAQVYDDSDEMLDELAETGEDLVRKSLMLEDMKSKAKLIYRSMVAFGTALVEDQFVERWQLEKKMAAGSRLGSESATWTERLVKTYDGCQSKLWDLRKCYFGDITKFFMNGPEGQPFFFTVEYVSFDIAKQFFGDWDRFKYVPNIVTMSSEIASGDVWSSAWTLRPIGVNYCELIRYYDPIANEYAFTINGIDMLPIMEKKTTVEGMEKTLVSGFPLTAISPSGAIPFAKYDNEPMHDFTYSKPQPAKMRVMADIENMWLKLLLGMAKQKAKPTMGNKSGRNFGPEVTDPGEIINDIRDGDLFPVLPNYRGPEEGDYTFYELIKTELDKNSIERSFQGMDRGARGGGPTSADETATKDMNDLRAQSLKVAAMFDGIISGNCQLYWLRTYNIAQNWTKPIDVQVDVFKKGIEMKYRTVSLPSEVEGGQKATKKIVFTKTPPKGKTKKEQSMTVHQEELDAAKAGKGETRHAYLNPEMFAQMKLSWFYTSVPVPNGSDPLGYMLFAKQVQDAQAMFGPQSLNVKKLKHKFASKTGEDFDTWFLNEQELQQAAQEAAAAQAEAAGATGGIPGKPVAGGPTQAGAASPAIPTNGMGAMMK